MSGRPIANTGARRQRHAMTNAERQEILKAHRENPGWSQQRLAQWASLKFGRPVRQSVISGTLQPRAELGEIVRYTLGDASARQINPWVTPVGTYLVKPTSLQVRGREDSWEQCLEIEQEEVDPPAFSTITVDTEDPVEEGLQSQTLEASVLEDSLQVRGESRWTHRRGPARHRPAMPKSPTASSMFLPQFFSGIVSDAINYSPTSAPLDVGTAWYTSLISRTNRSPVLHDASCSLLIRHAAERTGDARVRSSSRRHYGKALQGLQEAINSGHGINLDLVSAMMLLAFYEGFDIDGAYQERDPYVSHVNGTAQIIKMLGPKSFDSDYGRSVLHAFAAQVLCALYDSSATWFFDKEWHEVMLAGQNDESSRNANALAASLYACYFSLRDTRQRMIKLGPKVLEPQHKISLMDDLFRLRARLQDWSVQCKSSFPNQTKEPPEPGRVVYRPSNVRARTLFSAYEGVMTCILCHIKRIEPALDFGEEAVLLHADMEESGKVVPLMGLMASRGTLMGMCV